MVYAIVYVTLRAGSHGVPSPTHVSKSYHGGHVPTFEPQKIIKLWLIIIKFDLDYFEQIYPHDFFA